MKNSGISASAIIAWICIIGGPLSIFIIPAALQTGMAFNAFYILMLISASLISPLILIFTYKKNFRKWRGFFPPPTLLIVSVVLYGSVDPRVHPNLFAFFSVWLIIGFCSVGISTAVFLRHQDAGLKLFGGCLLIQIWVFFLSWCFHGNLLELFLLDLDFQNSNSALNAPPFLCASLLISFWLIPLGLIGFIVKTIRYIRFEFKSK